MSSTHLLQVELFALGLPAPVQEFRFHPTRKWRFDLAWPDQKVACEIEGGVFVSGRHVRGVGFLNDCEKYAEAAILGWRIIRVATQQVESGEAALWLERLLK
jgi:very-short-patch-repair endonuclease